MSNQFCINCGDSLRQHANFCHSCGKGIKGRSKDPHVISVEAAKRLDHHHEQHRRLKYFRGKRKSEIVTNDDENGEPVVSFRNLHPNAVWLFFIQYLGKSSILILIFALAALGEPAIASASFAGYLLTLYVIARINYKNYEFEVSPVAFKKVYGIFHKYTVNISYEQIQNINLRRSVIDRILGLAHLEIDTAGTGGEVKKDVSGLTTISEGYIPGITPEEADDVMELILARIQEAS